MRRGMLGLCLLGLLLAGSLILGRRTEALLGPPEQKLRQAAMAGEDQKITALTRQARAEWENMKGFAGVVFPQSAVEEIDGLFGRLELYGPLAPDCLRLAERLRALADSQSGKLLQLL